MRPMRLVTSIPDLGLWERRDGSQRARISKTADLTRKRHGSNDVLEVSCLDVDDTAPSSHENFSIEICLDVLEEICETVLCGKN